LKQTPGAPLLAVFEKWESGSGGNLIGYAYPNTLRTANLFDTLNRLTQTCEAVTSPACSAGTKLASYAYTLGNAGNRTNVVELSNRNVAYGYDNDCRLTSETITADPGRNYALRLRSVCGVTTAFHGFMCHPPTCMLLKLRLIVDSSPT